MSGIMYFYFDKYEERISKILLELYKKVGGWMCFVVMVDVYL